MKKHPFYTLSVILLAGAGYSTFSFPGEKTDPCIHRVGQPLSEERCVPNGNPDDLPPGVYMAEEVPPEMRVVIGDYEEKLIRSSVEEYAAGSGVRVTIYEPIKDEWFALKDSLRGTDDLERVRDIVHRHIGTGRDYQLRQGSVKSIKRGSSGGPFFARQRFAGLDTRGLRVEKRVVKDKTYAKISGNLVNPDLPQLDPKNWISEQEAFRIAVAAMRSYTEEYEGDSFSTLLEQGLLEGEIFLHDREVDGEFVVEVKYRLQTSEAVAVVNMYTGGVIEAGKKMRRHNSSEVGTNVCRPTSASIYKSCFNNNNLPDYPQTQAIFGENSGSPICLGDPPFGQLNTVQYCQMYGYYAAHEAVQKSEDLLGTLLPDACCDDIGRSLTIWGTTFKQLDIQMDSNLLSSAHGLFEVAPGDFATIHINSSLSTESSPGGWANLVGHEWSHAYTQYYGASGDPESIGGGTSTQPSRFAALSMEEGLSDVWGALLNRDSHYVDLHSILTPLLH